MFQVDNDLLKGFVDVLHFILGLHHELDSPGTKNGSHPFTAIEIVISQMGFVPFCKLHRLCRQFGILRTICKHLRFHVTGPEKVFVSVVIYSNESAAIIPLSCDNSSSLIQTVLPTIRK
ncbi:hypothetical protein CEXT_469071 [Caerostris extrusa]|uniref:Uncharacterized protein n=1 Tax=Caerostris extrusa TaxID=172846 RepID=A0AAV4XRC9_CAEEX|nr:hypothetical protein CEXT_469071 [Caerostris extrusa]